MRSPPLVRAAVALAFARLVAAAAWVCLAYGSVPAARAEQDAPGSPAPLLTVTYVTSTTAYLDAGSDAGLRVGDVFEILRQGVVQTTVEVEALSTKRASCRRTDRAVPIEIGAKARWTRDAPRISPEATPLIATSEPRPRSGTGLSGRMREFGLRGRLGLRYVGIRARGDLASDFNQPGVEFRLDGRSVGGTDFGLFADLRAQRTIRTVGVGDAERESRTRVYRLSADWRSPGRPLRVALGRQLSTTVASIGVFDGAAADWTTSRWTFGALAGSPPDPSHFGYSSEIREGGAFAEWRSAKAAARSWRLALGAITSRREGEIHRDFAALQASTNVSRVAATWIQEFDWYRGWRRDEEGETFDVTSTFVSVRAPLGERVVANAGYDNRRSVRLLRDEITPETDFDDRYRQGQWGGLEFTWGAGGRVGLSVRRHAGGASGEARSATLLASLCDAGRREASIRARSTRYEGVNEDGWLHSVSAGANLLRRLRADFTGGVRTTQPASEFAQAHREDWVAMDLECPVTNPIYILLSGERSWTEGEGESLRVYASGVYRF